MFIHCKSEYVAFFHHSIEALKRVSNEAFLFPDCLNRIKRERPWKTTTKTEKENFVALPNIAIIQI